MPRKKDYSRVPSEKSGCPTSPRKLDWFFLFLRYNLISIKEAASILNYREATLYHWKQRDNVNLSLVKKIVEALGFSLEIKICRDPDWDVVSNITKREMRHIIPGRKEPNCLAPLAAAMSLYDYSAFRLSKELNICYTTIRYWLKNDDIFISHLFEVANCMHCHILIHVIKKSDPSVDSYGKNPKESMFISVIDGPTANTKISDYL